MFSVGTTGSDSNGKKIRILKHHKLYDIFAWHQIWKGLGQTDQWWCSNTNSIKTNDHLLVCTFNKHIDHHEQQLKALGRETMTVLWIYETLTQTMDSYTLTKWQSVLDFFFPSEADAKNIQIIFLLKGWRNIQKYWEMDAEIHIIHWFQSKWQV